MLLFCLKPSVCPISLWGKALHGHRPQPPLLLPVWPSPPTPFPLTHSISNTFSCTHSPAAPSLLMGCPQDSHPLLFMSWLRYLLREVLLCTLCKTAQPTPQGALSRPWAVFLHDSVLQVIPSPPTEEWFSALGAWPPTGHLRMPREVWVVTTGGGDATSIWWVDTKDAAKHPKMLRTASHNKKLSGPKC